MTFNTGNPIGSTDARDLSDNAENFDKALGTLDATWTDRLGVTRDSFEGRLAKGSFYRVGTFAEGYTLTNMRQTLEYSGHEYSWAGTFPKVVAAGATPATSGGIGAGAWVDRTDVTLRSEINIVQKRFACVADMISDTSLAAGINKPSIVETLANENNEGIVSKWVISNVQYGYSKLLSNGLYAVLKESNGDLRHYGLVSGGDIREPIVKALDSGKRTIKIPKLAAPYTLSSNLVRSDDYIRLWFEQEVEIKLTGVGFNQAYGAVELTGNHVKISGGLAFTTDNAMPVTPLRVGNTSYGSTDATRRKGIKVKSVRMINTGYGYPNHGNFVIIGAIDPDLSFIRLEGIPTSNGNFEVLGCKGGSARDCYAEEGILLNFHATSADSVGYPTEDFTFIRCIGKHSLSTVTGDNNFKISRNCSRVKAINCKAFSYASGSFIGNAHSMFMQGVSNCAFIDCDIFMQNNGQYRASYGIHDHGGSLTGSYQNKIKGGTVTINTPGANNRVVLFYEAYAQSIARNEVSDVTVNCYNGTLDAFAEMNGVTSGLINDNLVKNNFGVGVNNAILSRLNVGVNWLSGNKLNGLIDQSYTYSGENKQVFDSSAPNWVSKTLSTSGTVTLPLPSKSRNSARITLNQNTSGGNVLIDGFTLDSGVTISDGYQVTITSVYNVSSLNTVALVHGGNGRFRLSGGVNFSFAGYSSITLQAVGADWVEVSRRA